MLFSRRILTIRRLSVLTGTALILTFLYLPRFIAWQLGAAFAIKVFTVLLVVMPLGFLLGMFFPQGLNRLAGCNEELIPWAWGLNGYTCVLGSATSIYLVTITGFSWYLFFSALIYFSLPIMVRKEL